MGSIIASVNDIVWGVPALLLILGVGLYLSVKLCFAQLTLLPEALKQFLRQFVTGYKRRQASSFQALCGQD